MAYPLTSELGNLTCTAASGDLLYLFGTAIRVGSDVATLTIESNEYDATTPTGTAVAMRTMNAGLRQGTVAFTGLWPRAANPLGLSALITYAAGYVQYVRSFTINMAFPEIPITASTGADGSYVRYMPGGTGTWGGTYTCLADNATALSMPSIGAASAATFKLAEDGASDPTLTGNITTPRLVQTVKIGSESQAVYSFTGSGALTQAAGSALPGIFAASGAITKPTWDISGDGVPDNTCVLTVASGRTYSFPAFWTSLSMNFQTDQPVQISGTLRIADIVTVA